MALKYHALDTFRRADGGQLCTQIVMLGNKANLTEAASTVPQYITTLTGFSANDPARVTSLINAVVDKLSPSQDAGSSLDVFVACGNDQHVLKVTLAALPSGTPSRHNAPAQPHAASDLLKSASNGEGPLRVLLLLSSKQHALALGSAVARVLPLYTFKSTAKPPRPVDVIFSLPIASLGIELINQVSAVADGIRLACRLVDMPTNHLYTDGMVEEARQVQARLKNQGHMVTLEVIEGEELDEKGLGGIYGVGKAADHPPALAILSHVPMGSPSGKSVVWVGKGIVYDTGGLSIKTKSGMPGMKRDMGGAAAVLAAFEAAVRSGNGRPLHALLCLAENSVDSQATRPDDIHRLYSGKTVEINNTDAEGRLVLSDGVAYATKHLNPEVVIDMATLTGAQGIATGKRHGAIYCNDEVLEQLAVQVGKYTGDLNHPLPYCPEFFQCEFRSVVADMKNSVANRDNAQASCAGQFIGSHMGDFVNTGKWLHIDMAGPVYNGERATGYGVALLVSLLAKLT